MWFFKKKKVQEEQKPPPRTCEPMTCEQCVHFIEYKTPAILKPDKTVIHSEVAAMHCRRGDFVLTDTKPCELYTYNVDWQVRDSIFAYKPPCNKSSVQRIDS